MACGERKVMICGSRNIKDKEYIFSQLDAFTYWQLACFEYLTLIEGEAKGVDTIAKEYAIQNGWEQITEYPADWDKYGKGAGFIRNEQMVKDCDECFIFWDGESKGTKHDIDLCIKYNKPYKVLIYNDSVKEEYVEKYIKN